MIWVDADVCPVDKKTLSLQLIVRKSTPPHLRGQLYTIVFRHQLLNWGFAG